MRKLQSFKAAVSQNRTYFATWYDRDNQITNKYQNIITMVGTTKWKTKRTAAAFIFHRVTFHPAAASGKAGSTVFIRNEQFTRLNKNNNITSTTDTTCR